MLGARIWLHPLEWLCEHVEWAYSTRISLPRRPNHFGDIAGINTWRMPSWRELPSIHRDDMPCELERSAIVRLLDIAILWGDAKTAAWCSRRLWQSIRIYIRTSSTTAIDMACEETEPPKSTWPVRNPYTLHLSLRSPLHTSAGMAFTNTPATLAQDKARSISWLAEGYIQREHTPGHCSKPCCAAQILHACIISVEALMVISS